ncbi:MAG: sigma-70 family RNA polymerase sigma factor [Dehalococcoidaceae bacterium]|nr:sigma-70 family RNA polymerase sigma factor [Dehalococcoidaceae bacterium]
MDPEQTLVERAKHNKQAFGELYEKYYPQIFGYALKRTTDVELARDITSQVFIKALKSIGSFRWRGAPFSSWLYRITANEIADYYRGRKRRQICLEENAVLLEQAGCPPEEEIRQAEEELARHEEFLALHQSIICLPFKYQEVIALRYFEGKPLKEIGRILGKSEGTVKSLLHRGLEKLKNMLE